MTPPVSWKFAVEMHPPGWSFPEGASWIAGWLTPAPGQTITDVRARLHHRVILGLFGLPHPAFTEKSAEPHAPVQPGFSFLLSPHRGASLLRLEARDQSGRWTEFFRTTISSATNAAVSAPTPDFTGALSRLITVLLQQHLCAPQCSWTDLRQELLATFVAEPLTAHPNLPFVGALEEPQDRGRLSYGRISVTGWLAHTTAKITRLSAVIDPAPGVTLPHGLERGDVTGLFPSLNGRTDLAFVGEVALPPDLAAPVLLKIFAELDNGESHLVFARRFTPHFHRDTGNIPPMVARSTFARAVWSLYRAARQHGLAPLDWYKQIRTIRACYRTMPVFRPRNIPARNEVTVLPGAAPAPRRNPTRVDAVYTAIPMAGTGGLPTCTLIDPADDMCAPDATHYFHIGQEAMTLVQDACARAGNTRIAAILDLPCGYGRVARWFRTAYPTAQLSVSDTQEAGVAFCQAHLGAIGVTATIDGRHWEALPGPYDIIWSGSLLTHFDWDEWINHLRRFAERLSPHGVLVFTSHGLPALERLQNGDRDYGLPPAAVTQLCHAAVTEGFGYVDYAGSPGYGISIAQPGWIHELITKETDLKILKILPAVWGQHQDVVICTRRLPAEG